MSLLIPGEKMPETCDDCPCSRSDDPWTKGDYCTLIGNVFGDTPFHGKRDDCPLVEIQTPHGRLIDADAFETDVRCRYCHECDNYNGLKCKACWVDDMLGEIEDAPTIVPAEEEPDGE